MSGGMALAAGGTKVTIASVSDGRTCLGAGGAAATTSQSTAPDVGRRMAAEAVRAIAVRLRR